MLRREAGIETEIVTGRLGELSVWLDGQRVAKQRWFRPLSDDQVLGAVRGALAGDPATPLRTPAS